MTDVQAVLAKSLEEFKLDTNVDSQLIENQDNLVLFSLENQPMLFALQADSSFALADPSAIYTTKGGKPYDAYDLQTVPWMEMNEFVSHTSSLNLSIEAVKNSSYKTAINPGPWGVTISGVAFDPVYVTQPGEVAVPFKSNGLQSSSLAID